MSEKIEVAVKTHQFVNSKIGLDSISKILRDAREFKKEKLVILIEDEQNLFSNDEKKSFKIPQTAIDAVKDLNDMLFNAECRLYGFKRVIDFEKNKNYMAWIYLI